MIDIRRNILYCNVSVAGLTVANPAHGSFYKPPTGGRRWRPGTQALREVCNLMTTTNLCIPKAPFLWLVHVNMSKMSDMYSTVHTPVYSSLFLVFLVDNVRHICTLYYFFSRLVREIMFRKSKRLADEDCKPKDYTDAELAEGECDKCLLRWQQNALDALHEAAESYLISLMEDANLLAIHAHRITLQPRDICRQEELRGVLFLMIY